MQEKTIVFTKKLLTKLKCYFIIIHVVTDAEIAQLVEHNLAKVGVASSSLVFRSMQIHPGQTAGIFLLPGKPCRKENVRLQEPPVSLQVSQKFFF